MELEKTSEVQGLSKPSRQASRLRFGRRTFIAIAVVVVILLISSVVVVSGSTISRLTITLSNSSDHCLIVHVYVDEFDDVTTSLEPQESVSFHWNITGWPVHRYCVSPYDPESDWIVQIAMIWKHIVVVPFTERTMALEIR